MTKIDRVFNISDAELLEHSEIVNATLPSDMPSFTTFDSTINNDYIPRLSQAIFEAKDLPTAEVIMYELAEQTLLVESAATACYDDYKSIAYFARKAFSENPAIQNQFGMNNIEKARKSQPKMVIFMESLAKTATKYQEQLIQAGCNPQLIAGLADKVLTLHNANIAQEKFKNVRAIITQNRILLLNKVYELLQPLHDAALNIFRNDPQRLSIYTMPQTNPPDAPPDKQTPA